MATIYVSAIMSEGMQVLLARNSQGIWELPGGSLLDDDDTIEDGLSRVLREEFGLQVQTQEFLDTYHQPSPKRQPPTLRNVSLVGSWSGIPSVSATSGFSELRWVPLHEVGELTVDETTLRALAEGLGVHAAATPAPGAPVILIIGPSAAGKSTIARSLCRHFERSAHIEVDLLRHMVISGYASPVPGVANPFEAAQQKDLALANVASLARNFSLAGFQTVIDTVIESPEELDGYLEPFAGLAKTYVVTLLPSAASLRERDGGRTPDVRQGERSQDLLRLISVNGETRGLRFDTSSLSIGETTEYILAHLDQARVL
ncbi:MAG: NUDIX domain-containing protein [Dehalococcoidia bacterium]